MSQDNSKSATVGTAYQDTRFHQTVRDDVSDSRARVIDSRPATIAQDMLLLAGDRSVPRGSQVEEKSLVAPTDFGEIVAEFTLRAGGKVISVAMRHCGGTDSHLEVLSSERLSLEQWSHLYDNITVLAHSMMLLDHPDDGD